MGSAATAVVRGLPRHPRLRRSPPLARLPVPGGGYAPVSRDSCLVNAPIKGNQSGIYHVPGGQFYDRTNPEECFESESEAQAAGYRRSQR